mmetsp:Transcript_38602/g.56832  ORF Transcript_38602/g.56832 Transcript_38602/m.56832 type:complete len:476 (+) Transcript_38602:120-1547(+)
MGKYEGFAWLILFLPTVIYYIRRLTHEDTFLERYRPISTYMEVYGGDPSLETLNTLVHLKQESSGSDGNGKLPDRFPFEKSDGGIRIPLVHPAEVVLQGFVSVSGPTWVHDEELGRGYLLFSDGGANRIWRWEVGGGPITIGRTLHMEKSGCRSNATLCSQPTTSSSLQPPPTIGSSGMSVAKVGPEPHLLVVCEQGEKRIVRIETDGARTPLVTHDNDGNRLHAPKSLAFTPFGDFVFTDPLPQDVVVGIENGDGGGVWKVHEAVHVPPIPASQSRAAHFQKANATLELLYSKLRYPSGVALSHDYNFVYVSDADPENLVIVKIPLEEEEEEDSREEEDSHEEDSHEEERECINDDSSTCTPPPPPKGLMDTTTSILFDATSLSASGRAGVMGGLAIDEHGNIWAAGPGGVLIVSPTGDLLGCVPTGMEVVTDVAFGADGYLYLTTHTKLLRMKVQVKGVVVPNLVTKKNNKKI